MIPHGTSRVRVGLPTLRSVAAKGTPKGTPNGPQRVKWLNRYNSAVDCPIWLKFCMTTHTKVSDGERASTLESEVEFPYQGGVFSNSVLGHIFGADQDTFTKFGVYVENGLLQRVEWSIYARSNVQDGGRRPS